MSAVVSAGTTKVERYCRSGLSGQHKEPTPPKPKDLERPNARAQANLATSVTNHSVIEATMGEMWFTGACGFKPLLNLKQVVQEAGVSRIAWGLS
eukprot:4022120-Amphidinium_carterae.1